MNALGWLALGVGALIIVGLASYAGLLLARLQQQRAQQRQAIKQRNDGILSSIKLIAHAMSNGQCDYSEGVIRLANLLNALQDHGIDWPARFAGIYGLYQQIKEMPTHEARRALKRNELMRQDLERTQYEAHWQAQIDMDLAVLKTFQL